MAFRRARRVRRRVAFRRRRGVSNKRIARVAKRAVMATAETKWNQFFPSAIGVQPFSQAFSAVPRVDFSFSANTNNGITSTLNCVANLICPEGDITQTGVIGASMFVRGIQLRLAVQGNVETTWSNLRVLVFSPKGGSMTNNTITSPSIWASTIFTGAVSGGHWLAPVDTQTVRVHYDKIFNLKCQSTAVQLAGTELSAPTTRFIRKYIKINRKYQYPRAGYSWDQWKPYPVYLLMVSDVAQDGPFVAGGFIKVFYKDM